MFIYLVTNTLNGRRYVGRTVKTIPQRWAKHVNDAAANRYNVYLHRAIRRYGPEMFTVETLAHLNDLQTLLQAEKLFIQELGTFAPKGYNMTEGGDGSRGLTHSDATKAKLSRIRTGKPLSLAHRSAISKARKGRPNPWLKGKPSSRKGSSLSPEARANLRAANIGRKLTPETKAKMSVARMGNTNSVGRTHSPEMKARIAESMRRARKERFWSTRRSN